MKDFPVSGIWLRREGNYAVVLVEHEGEFVEVIREHIEGPFSHIVEPTGICVAIEKSRELLTA